MPISKKRFSKKRVKKSVKKNTRKYKKRTPRRKHRKSGKRVRFFGGFGEDGDCSICLEPLTNGEPIFTTNCQHNFHRGCIQTACVAEQRRGLTCTCPLCRKPLNPSPNPVVTEEMEHLYRVQFFTFVNNQQTGEVHRLPVDLHDIPEPEIGILENYFINQFPGLTSDNILFYGDSAGLNPYGYIDLDLDEIYNTVVINEGDMRVVIDPAMPINIQSVTIRRVADFDV